MIGLKLTNLNRPAFPIAEKSIEFVEYPKWIHMSGYASQLVDNADGEATLLSRPPKPGNVVIALEGVEMKADAVPMGGDREALIQSAKDKNIKIDARWTTARIRETIEKAI